MTPDTNHAPAGTRGRLLLVTDDLTWTSTFAVCARKAGFSVAVAAGKNTALLRLPAFAPEIVALSFRSPLAEGLDILRLLKRCGSHANVVWIDDHRTPKLDTACDLGRLMGLGTITTLCRYLPSERLAAELRDVATQSGCSGDGSDPSPRRIPKPMI